MLSAADEERRANFIGLTLPFDLIRPFTERSDPFVIEPEEYAEFVAHVPFQQEPHTLPSHRSWSTGAGARSP